MSKTIFMLLIIFAIILEIISRVEGCGGGSSGDLLGGTKKKPKKPKKVYCDELEMNLDTTESSAEKKVKNREGGLREEEVEEEVTTIGCINRTTTTLKPTTTFNLDLLFGTPPSTRKPITPIKPLTYEDFAEFHLDINKIMRDAGINPDDYRNPSPCLLAHISTLLLPLWFLLIEHT